MKTRKVLREFTVKDGVFLYEGFGYGNLGGVRAYLPDGTKAELAVYEDVPPKRELDVPEGVLWQRNLMRPVEEGQEYLLSINDGSLIGSVREDDDKWFWRAEYYNTGWRSTMREAEEAVYETFADLNRFDFSWKTIEPDWARYDVVTIWYKTNFGWTHYMTSEARMNTMLLESFEHFKKPNYFAVSLEGRLPDGSVEIIDRWEKEEK